jgi:hypothetical protein
VKDKELVVPRPSKALKLLSLDAVSLPLDKEGNIRLNGIAAFNGEEVISCVFATEYGLVENNELKKLEEEIFKRVNEGFKVLVYGDEVLDEIRSSGLESVSLVLKALRMEGRLLFVKDRLRRVLGLSAPLEEAERLLPEINRRSSIADIRIEYEALLAKNRGTLPSALKEDKKRFLKLKLRDYVSDNARSTMILYLVAESLKHDGVTGQSSQP